VRTLIIMLLGSVTLMASPGVLAEPQPLHAHTRESASLSGDWQIIVDPYEHGAYNEQHQAYDDMEEPPRRAFFRETENRRPGDRIEHNFDRAETLQVPGDWNTQKERLSLYDGTVWYRKKFSVSRRESGQRRFLHFNAANYRADVYLNGEKLGSHVGGHTPFHFEVTDKLRSQDNSLIVKVNSRRDASAVPSGHGQGWNYAGLTRSVRLLTLPEVFIRDYQLQLDDHRTSQVSGRVQLDGARAGEEVRIRMPELAIDETVRVDAEGVARFQFRALGAQLWSPDSPRMYQVIIRAGSDRITDEVGLRSVSTVGQQLVLNGQSLFLRGVNLHDEYPAGGGGVITSTQQARQLLLWASEMGANFVRLAGHPHSEELARLADQLGIMVWAELPVDWHTDWDNEETYQNAARQLTELIQRDKNRASVIIWSLAGDTPVTEARNQFLLRLAEEARLLDDTRLLTAPMGFVFDDEDPDLARVEDPLGEFLDLVSINPYIGWQQGSPDRINRVSWEVPYDRPVLISAFGAGARQGNQEDSSSVWSEAFQARLYRDTLAMLGQIQGYAGVAPYALMDFRSPRRTLPGVQDGFDRRGLMSERGERKEAFEVMREYYRQRASERVRLELLDD